MTMPTISKKTMLTNIMLFYPGIFLGSSLLWIKSIPLCLIYLLTLIVTIITCRYLICTGCYYYGKLCPSYGFSYLALMFPKVENGPFHGKAALTEYWIIFACALLPIISVAISWLGIVEKYSIFEYAMTVVYILLVLGADFVHKITGCNKCAIAECPLSMAANPKWGRW
jgi:hypothetical protein